MRPAVYAWNDKLQSSQPQCVRLAFKITGAKTVTEVLGAPVAYTFDAGLDTAAEIAAILPDLAAATDEFTAATAWGSTAMGTDAFGFIVDMGGQARKVLYVEARLYGGSDANITSMNGVTGADPVLGCGFQGQTTALTNALTNQCTVSSQGNVGGHIVITGLDALTAGLLVIDIYVQVK
ncbi:MAG TPA: hypothetical protein VEB22_12340 [Phycisphaerales bacterium]|nr:hypothetical protein [Phycisphaerales bacterium]